MSDFDPYHQWLGIPKTERPISKYRLLGLVDFELDRDVISTAVERQIVYLRMFQAGEHEVLVAQLLNEVSLARVTLLNVDDKAEYDEGLREQQTPEPVPEPTPLPIPVVQTPAPTPTSVVVRGTVTQEFPVSIVPTVKNPHSKVQKEIWKRPAVIGVSVVGVIGVFVLFISMMSSGDAEPVASSFSDPIAAEMAAEKAAAEKAAADKAATDKAATDKAATDKAAMDKAAMDKAAMDKAAEKAALEKAAAVAVALDKGDWNAVLSLYPNNSEGLRMKAAAEKADADKAAADKAKAQKAKAQKAVTEQAFAGTGVSGRGAEVRAVMVRDYGGTQQSEAAVAMALKWIVNHQNSDGSWSFDHSLNGQRCNCSKSGTHKTSTNGATAMALLPFLGAGNTHKKGKYREQVKAGLYYLSDKMKVKGATGDLTDPRGNMYSHGLAAITLCEAFAMTKDRQLMTPAQMALNFIVYAQDPVGGGWRYTPRQAGDTSVVGWQLMALKSGHMGYLQVPRATIQGCYSFLNSVAANNGATYGYTTPGSGQATTAIGLLCRMYMGWKRDEPALQRGVEQLAKWGPSKGNIYYNYYATQVMRHTGGKLWDVWNKELRDSLVASQVKSKSHSNGSWAPGSDHGARAGGRLYTTTLATMILEVYYRHMPIYAKQAAEDEFPL